MPRAAPPTDQPPTSDSERWIQAKLCSVADQGISRRGLLRQMISGAARATASAVPVFPLDVPTQVEPTPSPGPAPDEVLTRGRSSLEPASVEDMLRIATQVGLGDRTAELSQVVRRSVRLSPIASPTSVGRVTFGGQARLSRGGRWPQWQGRPLTLLVQLDLAGLGAAALPLSRDGTLLVFFDTVTVPSGLESAHRGAGRVLHVDEVGYDQDETAIDRPALPSVPLIGDVSVETMIPRVWSAAVGGFGLTEDEQAGWETVRQHLAHVQDTELTDAIASNHHIVHRVLGFADYTAGDMPLICELGASGYDVGELPAVMHPRAGELEQRSQRWELLAQLAADPELGWSWGQATRRLYFWIDRDALAAGDLSQIWTIAR